jgi:aminoglycoside phosphotransferase (APT) family kinase protein
VQTFKPTLDLLRQALGSYVQDYQAELIKTTLPWSQVYRVTLQTSQGHSTRQSVILKAVDPAGPNDARELHFYQKLYPKLPVPKPHIYYLGSDEVSGWVVLILQDLSPTHRIPEHPHRWTRVELQSVLRAYAMLHSASPLPPLPERGWLNARHESELDFDAIPDQVAVVQRAGIWDVLPDLPNLIDYARQSCRKYEDTPLSLLHSDTTPTNALLPQDMDSEPATLIDWQDAGIGMPEMDLAYIDLQPFESGRLIPRSELISIYWQHRAEIEDEIPTLEERANRQLHADLVMALWLTRPASRVALRPYPEGTYPRMHWDSQFGIVYNRLKELGREISTKEQSSLRGVRWQSSLPHGQGIASSGSLS